MLMSLPSGPSRLPRAAQRLPRQLTLPAPARSRSKSSSTSPVRMPKTGRSRSLIPPKESKATLEGMKYIRPESPVRSWPCAPFGVASGLAHLVLGFLIIVYDLITNAITESVFAITAGLVFLLCAMFSFIAARRLDKGTMTLLLVFSLVASGLCVTMFVEAVIELSSTNSQLCHRHHQRFKPEWCKDGGVANQAAKNAQVVLLVISCLELCTALLSVYVAYQSLRAFYRQMLECPASPYDAYIQPRLEQVEEPIIEVQKKDKEQTFRLQYLLRHA